MKSNFIFLVLILIAAVCLVDSAPGKGKKKEKGERPVKVGKVLQIKKGIPGSFLVRYKSETALNEKAKGLKAKGKKFKKMNILRDLVIEGLTAENIAELEGDSEVELIEQNQEINISCLAYDTDTTLWNLDRLDHVVSNPDGNNSAPIYDNQMIIDELDGGSDVYVYVIDTGIDDQHIDFMGRAMQVYSAFDDQQTDGHGHGTHVAGTVGGEHFGVAKYALLRGVKVFRNDGRGYISTVIEGLNWVINQHIERSKTTNARTIINMSLGGSYSQMENDAVATASSHGIIVVVAAGNAAKDAASVSPASAPDAITVAASNKKDKLAWFSNFGSVVDIIAPGVSILSAIPGQACDPAEGSLPTLDHPCMYKGVKTGTSMASPLVAGVLATWLQAKDKDSPNPTLEEVKEWIHQHSDYKAITEVPEGTTQSLVQLEPCASDSDFERRGSRVGEKRRQKQETANLASLLLKLLTNKVSTSQ